MNNKEWSFRITEKELAEMQELLDKYPDAKDTFEERLRNMFRITLKELQDHNSKEEAIKMKELPVQCVYVYPDKKKKSAQENEES
jgi:hypothetical protein